MRFSTKLCNDTCMDCFMLVVQIDSDAEVCFLSMEQLSRWQGFHMDMPRERCCIIAFLLKDQLISAYSEIDEIIGMNCVRFSGCFPHRFEELMDEFKEQKLVLKKHSVPQLNCEACCRQTKEAVHLLSIPSGEKITSFPNSTSNFVQAQIGGSQTISDEHAATVHVPDFTSLSRIIQNNLLQFKGFISSEILYNNQLPAGSVTLLDKFYKKSGNNSIQSSPTSDKSE